METSDRPTARNTQFTLGSHVTGLPVATPPVQPAAAHGAASPRSAADALSVLHVLAPARFGGLETIVQELACGHAARGHTIRVAIILREDGTHHPVVTALRQAGIDVEVLVVTKYGYARERAAVAALVRASRPLVVHTHGYRPDVIDAPAARRAGAATVTTVHGFTGGGLRNRVYEWIERRAFRHFDAVVAVSDALALRLRRAGVPPRRTVVVRNACGLPPGGILPRAEARSVLGLDPDEYVVGWVGRLAAEKGCDVLLRAIARLAPTARPRTVIVGDGYQRDALHRQAAALGLDGTVRWAGAHPHAGRLLAAFDLFVLSSRMEGTPVTLLEAMWAGVPAVAARVGGVGEMVTDREALLIPPDDPGALVAALTAARDDPDAARARAARARAHVETYLAPEAWLDAYEVVYRCAAAGWPLPASISTATAERQSARHAAVHVVA